VKIQSLRGMPDLFPEDLDRWHIFESKLANIFHSFDTHEIRTPLLESTELFSRSVGNSSDIVNKELYSFLDRNEESISLRPEGSASVIRAVIQKKQEQEKHKFWYQGPMFRYERPQKGRFRQFHQVGVEYLGFEEGIAEYELMSMVLQINKLIGISDYTIKINHLGDRDAKESFCDSLVTFLKPHINELHEKDQVRLKSNPLRVLDSKEKPTQELLKEGPKFQDFISDDSKIFLQNLVDAYSNQCDIQIDQSLVRGLDYYTGIVFETVSQNLGAQDALLGGGRYDNLSRQLGGKDMHAIGFAIGVERIIELLNIEKIKRPLKVGFIIAGEQIDKKTYKIADDLRSANNSIILDSFLSEGSLKSHLRRANKNNCSYAIIIGEEELKNDQVIWKDLSEGGGQELLTSKEVIDKYTNL
jgi:histidyl-tRNA synthetase|tara:strand:+ start:829 stop:2073 length:1245 start_codon:yes stop_codon:yes gene_type:complete